VSLACTLLKDDSGKLATALDSVRVPCRNQQGLESSKIAADLLRRAIISGATG
jgi:hypothetical protein